MVLTPYLIGGIITPLYITGYIKQSLIFAKFLCIVFKLRLCYNSITT